MRRELELVWAVANVVFALALVGSLIVATQFTLPVLAVGVLVNVVATRLR